jgi:hypothetical protein
LKLDEIARAVEEKFGERYATNITSKELRRQEYSRTEVRCQAR